MAKKTSNKISMVEPADRPFSVALSEAEICILARHHVAQTKRISKEFGQQALQLSAKSIFGSPRELKALKDVCMEQLKAHQTRALGLISIIK